MGEGVETCLFIPLAFYGVLSIENIIHMVIGYFAFKVSYAFLAMPFISVIIDKLKAMESLPNDLALQ